VERPDEEEVRRRCGEISVVAGVVLVDQFTKAAVPRAGVAGVAPVRNPGLLLGAVRVPAFAVVAALVVAMVLFVGVVGRLACRIGVSPVLPALVAGGMIGNGLDRALLGAVRDFLPTPFAIINLADITVIIGIIGLTVGFARRMRALRCVTQTMRPNIAALGTRVGARQEFR